MQGITLFQSVAASAADTPPQITSPLTIENLECIKYHLQLVLYQEQEITKQTNDW